MDDSAGGAEGPGASGHTQAGDVDGGRRSRPLMAAPGAGRDGRRASAGWRVVAIGIPLVLAALQFVSGAAAAGVHDPWQPRGRERSDRERYVPAPADFEDQRGPVEQAPKGVLRQATTDRTNIVVIMIDDHPQTDDRVWRRLPNIRSLFLEQGLRFSRFHGNDPLCCPGRASFLTGLTTDHHGVWSNEPRRFDPRLTIATELRSVGYYTFWAGKYLNGDTSGIDRTPPGWSRISWTSNAYYRYIEWLDGRRIYHDDDPNDYQPDVAFNRALTFLRDVPASRPVFAVISPFSVHGGDDPFVRRWPKHYAPAARRFRRSDRCDGIPRWKTAAHDDDNGDRPVHQRDWDLARDGYKMTHVCRALLAVDAGVGRVVDELRAQRRLHDTLLVLTADNGMGWGAHGWIGKSTAFATHMPLFIRWPAGRGVAPATDDTYLSNVDLAPTFCEIGGCAMGPYPGGPTGPDGTSFLSIIRGTGALERRAHYSVHLAQPLWRQVMTTPDSPLGLWKYVEYGSGERELYSTRGGQCWEWKAGDAGDPCELTNLAGHPDYAEVEASLHELLGAAVLTGGAGVRFSGRETRARD